MGCWASSVSSRVDWHFGFIIINFEKSTLHEYMVQNAEICLGPLLKLLEIWFGLVFCCREKVQKQPVEERVNFIFLLPGHCPSYPGQELKQKPWRNFEYWLLPKTCSVCIPMHPGATCTGVAPPIVAWDCLLH